MNNRNKVLNLISNLKLNSNSRYIEEFDIMPFDSNDVGILKLLSSIIPGVGTYNTWQCLKRTNFGLFKKTALLFTSVFYGMIVYLSCLLASAGEALQAFNTKKLAILFEDLVVTFEMDKLYHPDDKKFLVEYENEIVKKSKLLKLKYPVFQKELENQIIFDYGKLNYEFLDGYIRILSKLTAKRRTEQHSIKLAEFRTELEKFKLEINEFKNRKRL